MFLRALTIALWCACASALTPLSAAGDDNDCALYLTGPGRTSAYDYSLNLLKGNFGYEGQHTCITYDAVNQAYLEARNRIVVSQPKGDWKPEDFASVGELMLDISINLARTYGLTYEEIEKGLPLVDTSRTLIREVCPPVFSHVECRAGKYRRLDGLCNNLQHPTWGATNAPFQRLIGPLFADGINAPRISHTGRDLPLSRVVSRTMHPDDGFHDHAGTVMVIAWGQFMDHDYTLTGTPLDPVNRNDPEECCKRPPHLKHPYCNEIRVPEDDYFYRLFGVKCIDFVRGFPSPRPGCRLGSRVPFNTLTGAIDGNTVYGVTDKFARKLRTGYGGLLRMNPVFKEYGLRDLLPLKLDIPDEGCTRPNKNMYCFEAGEIRVNEQLVLTVMHTLMAREHNRVAKALAEVNPHWDDETLYQEARRINIAEIQHITYNEFLPILLGKDVMEKFGLVLEKEGYWNGYDPEVNPDVIASFAAAAYRFGHSLLPTAVERWSKAHKFIASKRLSDLIRRPYDLYRAGVLDEYVMGLMNQVAQAMDDSITQEVTNHLFKKVGARFGMDLVSFNMQRGREFGLPGYMEFRKFCGLPGAESFQDLFGTMSNETVRKYESIFEHPIDVDLWSGGVSERPLPGSMLGPTFACIIATQFSYSRRGDRFWYELPNQPSTFTPEQLTEIRKARLARVICDNTDIIDTVQLYPMVLPDHELNPRVPCRSGIIPSMDFTKWAEPAPFQGSAKQFITDAVVFNKNKTGCISESSNNTNETESGQEKQDTTQNDNNCNITNGFKPTQSANLITLDISTNISSNNTPSKSTNDCGENGDILSEECHNKLKATNEIPNTDTVLKYVYKKNDKIVNEKPKGHPLNSVRRKRSIDIKNNAENITADASLKAPIIVDYETAHAPRGRDVEQVLPVHHRVTDNTIKNSALADFNIETLHDNQTPKNDNLNKDSSSSQSEEDKEGSENKNYSQSNSRESSESDYLRDRGNSEKENKKSSESDESGEKEEYRKRDGDSSSAEDSREVTDDDRPAPQKEKSAFTKYEPHPQSFENYESKEYPTRNKGEFSTPQNEKYENNGKYNSKSTENSGSSESRESSAQDTDPKKSSYKERVDDSRESSEKEKYQHHDSSREQHSNEKPDSKNAYKYSDDSSQSRESSNESNNDGDSPTNDRISNKDNIQGREIDLNTPRNIQDVDLDDFSYERVKVDDKGKILSSTDHDESDSPAPRPLVTPDTDQNLLTGSLSLKNEEQISGGLFDNAKPVHINDGEVKPVVEINSENNESESFDENSKEALKTNPDKDASLETILGTSINDAEEQNEKKHLQNKEPEEKADVKQQFERIPLNYKHENKQEESDKSAENDSKNNPQEENANEANQGTLDTFSPEDVNYDEHLKFKFDDIAIKLPEIKLPEDILAYTYEEPSYEKNKDKYEKRKHKKPKFYHYSDEVSEERPHEEKKGRHDDDNEHDYYGHSYDKQNLKKKDDDEEDEDLYEKFVRERFGKRGSFEKRSEKLEAAKPYNPELYQRVQSILKQSAQIDKQAQKSGDPNAGYMWTLEYGENLK